MHLSNTQGLKDVVTFLNRVNAAMKNLRSAT